MLGDNGKHDDQVDSTAQFVDWFKKPFPGQNVFELYRREAEKGKPPKPLYVRIKAPPGIGAVHTFSSRHVTISEDRVVEMSEEDADCLIPYGAHSGDVGRAFRLMSAACSDRSRPAVPIDVGRGGGAPAGWR